jgi:5-methylcytosine-specific restriction protein B
MKNLMPKLVIKIPFTNKRTIENYRKTIIEGLEINGERRYFWNKPRQCSKVQEEDLILFLSKDLPSTLVKVKSINGNGEIYKTFLKSAWKDTEERFKTYIELEKISELNLPHPLLDEILKENLPGQVMCKYFDRFLDKDKQLILNFLEQKLKQQSTEEDIERKAYSFCFRNLKLEKHIINSFYNALKTKGFVILAGLSGTGKTKIFENFVKCFPSKGITEKWITIKGTGEKLVPVKKEEIEFNNGKIQLTTFVEALNETLGVETNRKIALKLGNYYTDFIPTVEKLKEKTNLVAANQINNHLATYIACLFGFEVIEKQDVENLKLKKLDREVEIKEFQNKIENHLFFPIRPDFKDSKSLLGFYNPLTKQYHSTPLLELILEATKNYMEKGKNADPFFVLFDEMNLARVEYYFADFLSVLEAKRFQNKDEALNNSRFLEFLETLDLKEKLSDENFKFTSQSIKLHNEDIKGIPKELFLPPNLYFVGTVNIDETTYMFSPKVLDRAFTIEFDVGSFEEYLEFLNQVKEKENSITSEELKKDFTDNGAFAIIDKDKIKEFFKEEGNREYLHKLEKINKILKKFNLHFGYRVFDEIVMFLYNSQSSLFQFENLDEAFDLAVKMKVLPKFHGTRQKLEQPVKELLKEFCEIEDPDGLIDNGIPTWETIKEKTQYVYTAHKLLEMLYRLKTQGFASFI